MERTYLMGGRLIYQEENITSENNIGSGGGG